MIINPTEQVLRRISQWSFFITAGISLVSLLGWYADFLIVASIHPRYIPIAISSAFCFILLSVSLSVYVFHPENHARRKIAIVGISLSFLICLMILIGFFLGNSSDIEHLGILSPAPMDNIPTGHMSPITAVTFLMMSVAAFFLVFSSEGRIHFKQIASCYATVVFAIGFVFMLGYLYGTPLLYGGPFIPVALPTAIAFEFISLGIITASGADVLPVRVFVGSTVSDRLMKAFMPFIIGVVLFDGLLYRTAFHRTSNPAMIASLITLLSVIVVSIVVSKISKFIGGEIDRAHVERDRAEEEQKRLISELERSNRELEQFAFVASHDMQEPLRMVASYVGLLEKKYKGHLDEKADKYIHFAVDGALRMKKLIEGLLAYSRIGRQGAAFMPVDADDVFSRAVSNLEAALAENRAIITRDDLPTVPGDELQLMQLLQNLLSNAIKFGKPDTPPVVHVSAKKKGGAWIFSVRDNGIGIDAEYYNRIFLIFQRLHTREEYPGTGIGLALCKRIVERHSGRIWVESVPGEGTTFFFSIPIGGGK